MSVTARINQIINSLSSTGTIFGGAGPDLLSTFSDGNFVFGLGGNDRLGSTFNDTLLTGGSGDDQMSITATVPPPPGGIVPPQTALGAMRGGLGDDQMRFDVQNLSGNGTQTAIVAAAAGLGNDVIDANAYAFGFDAVAENVIDAGSGDNTVNATVSVDADSDGTAINSICAGDGNDAITASASADAGAGLQTAWNVIDAGHGTNTIDATATGASIGWSSDILNQITTGSDRDTITLAASGTGNGDQDVRNAVSSGAGNDVISATVQTNSNIGIETGENRIFASDGRDYVDVSAVSFGGGSDSHLSNIVTGGRGSDTILADASSSANFTATAENRIFGGEGQDAITVGARAGASSTTTALNTVWGGRGNDTIAATAGVNASTPVTVWARNELRGEAGDDDLYGEIVSGSPGFSSLHGGIGDDVLTVVGGNGNVLDGGEGDDSLSGSDARDALSGGEGQDVLRAGGGDDSLTGGLDRDTFVFDSSADEGTNTVFGFNRSEDRFQFSDLVDAGAPGLADDLAAIATVVDAGLGLDVTISFTGGTDIVLVGAGTGTISAIEDLFDDPATQLLDGTVSPFV